MVVRRIFSLLFAIIFSLLFYSCGKEPVYIISDPELQELKGNFLKERIISALGRKPTRYQVLDSPDEIFTFIESAGTEDGKSIKLVLSPSYWNLHQRLEEDGNVEILWLNINPYEHSSSVYNSWNLLPMDGSIRQFMPQGTTLVFYSRHLLSQEQLTELQQLFDYGLDIQWKEVNSENLSHLEEEIDLSTYGGFFLAAGSLNPALYNLLRKQNIPFGGEIPYLNIPSDLWYLKIEDNWSLMVTEAINHFSEGSAGLPVPVVPLWEGNDAFRRP